MASRLDPLRSKWFGFWYNFRWSAYVQYLDGWIPRLAMTVPLVGYLILFNDSIAQHLSFQHLASETSVIGLSSATRLKLIYLGLITLGLANVIFRWKRPYLFRLASNRLDWIDRGLSVFSISDYVGFHEKISFSGVTWTGYGKYDDAEWDSFVDSALGPQISNTNRQRNYVNAHWNNAKLKHENLLRSILAETYFRDDSRTRRGWLIFCLALASIGYVLLAIPSIDLFCKVIIVIVEPLLISPV